MIKANELCIYRASGVLKRNAHEKHSGSLSEMQIPGPDRFWFHRSSLEPKNRAILTSTQSDQTLPSVFRPHQERNVVRGPGCKCLATLKPIWFLPITVLNLRKGSAAICLNLSEYSKVCNFIFQPTGMVHLLFMQHIFIEHLLCATGYVTVRDSCSQIKGRKGRREQGREGRRLKKSKRKHEKEKYRSAKKERKRFLKNFFFFLITRHPTVETQCLIPNDWFTYLSAECTYILLFLFWTISSGQNPLICYL